MKESHFIFIFIFYLCAARCLVPEDDDAADV